MKGDGHKERSKRDEVAIRVMKNSKEGSQKGKTVSKNQATPISGMVQGRRQLE